MQRTGCGSVTLRHDCARVTDGGSAAARRPTRPAALAAGAWLGGQRAALLMQSSGVGNCINMLSLPLNCRMPFLALVTMRGEWAEFNPWQVPMGSATQPVLAAAGVHVRRAEHPDDAAEIVAASAALAFDSHVPVAVLLAQRLIGAKVFVE